jgi:hypothetical protein
MTAVTLSVLAIGPTCRVFRPGEGDGFFMGDKNLQHKNPQHKIRNIKIRNIKSAK